MNYNIYDKLSWQKLGNQFDNDYYIDFPWRHDVIEKLLKYDPKIDNMLDVACCIGWYIGQLRRHGFKAKYQGVDITPNFIKRARRANPREKFELGDVRKLRWKNNTFDLVFAGGLLMHLDPADLPKAMSELFRVANQSVFLYSFGHRNSDKITYDSENRFFNVYYTMSTLVAHVPKDWVLVENTFQHKRHFLAFRRLNNAE